MPRYFVSRVLKEQISRKLMEIIEVEKDAPEKVVGGGEIVSMVTKNPSSTMGKGIVYVMGKREKA